MHMRSKIIALYPNPYLNESFHHYHLIKANTVFKKKKR